MNVDRSIQSIRNRFSDGISGLQNSFAPTLYGTPPGWDKETKKPIPGTPANMNRIEKICRLKGF